MTHHISCVSRAGRGASKAHSRLANPVATVTMIGATAVATFTGCLERHPAPLEPNTTNVFARPIQVDRVEAIDLLFVVDNSASMADKQALLREAVPLMVDRLVTPDCVREDGRRGERMPNDGQHCASYGQTFAEEFRPVSDIHLGVITSSLGGFGSTTQCSDAAKNPHELDRALLIPKVRRTVPATGENVPDPTGFGFLAWTGAAEGADVEAAKRELGEQLALHVAAAGETGCGFEAPLEAWYRFLVDPSPPAGLIREGNVTVSTDIDTEILEQRAQFLRPGSLVAIVVLTDENDCSAMEGGAYYPHAGSGWITASPGSSLRAASAACEENPNDRCCHSCSLEAPEGCADTCQQPLDSIPPENDRANARCIQQKRRFGIDLLYPTERYVDGLEQRVIIDSQTGQSVLNPLLRDRSPDLVFFAGIVGVPWQDIATRDSLEDPDKLEYLSARALRTPDSGLAANRWDVVLGRPGLDARAPACAASESGGKIPEACGQTPIAPLDPFMIESVLPRHGTNPITGDAIVAPGSSGWSPINGHEYDNSVPFWLDGKGPSNDDLQYSCIFPLAPLDAEKVDCDQNSGSCDCTREPDKNRPLCKPSQSAGSTADRTQRYGKAYPASRILQVLQDFGDNSIVSSICPKILDRSSPSFGYNPAVNAIVDRLTKKLTGQCLPRELTLTDGRVPCHVVEALREKRDCASIPGRAELTDDVHAAVLRQLVELRICTEDASAATAGARCADFSLCEIQEVAANARPACFDATPADQQSPGYCYIDPGKGPSAGGVPGSAGGCTSGDEASYASCVNPNVAFCRATERRMLRFVGDDTPTAGSTTFVVCAGDAPSGDGRLPDLPATDE